MQVPNWLSSEALENIVPPLKARSEPFAGINFVVMLGTSILGFQSVSGLSQKKEMDYIVEGGRNDRPIFLKKPRSQPQTLTFKRGYRSRTLASSLPFVDMLIGDTWIDWPNALGLIFVLGNAREMRALFSFKNMGLIEWSMSDLDAQSSVPCIETFTIGYTDLQNKAIPINAMSALSSLF